MVARLHPRGEKKGLFVPKLTSPPNGRAANWSTLDSSLSELKSTGLHPAAARPHAKYYFIFRPVRARARVMGF
jgi:hypothetical protein